MQEGAVDTTKSGRQKERGEEDLWRGGGRKDGRDPSVIGGATWGPVQALS